MLAESSMSLLLLPSYPTGIMAKGAKVLLKTSAFPWDAWVTQSVKHLPLAQVMIPGSWDRALHGAPCLAGSLLLPLPACPPACALSLTNK